eukprot:COSAG01_NODE_829_length_13273_cov_7.729695_1_plen_221_part_10
MAFWPLCSVLCDLGNELCLGTADPSLARSLSRLCISRSANNATTGYATALKRNYDKTGNKTLLENVLQGYKTQFMQFTTAAAPGNQQKLVTIDHQAGLQCLYNVPGNDAQEGAISGPGCRPLVQSTMYGEAVALAEMFAATGDQESAAEMAAEARVWQQRVLQQWNANLSSFDTIHPAVPPMPRGWSVVPDHDGRICNSTMLWQGFDLRDSCTKRCIADTN